MPCLAVQFFIPMEAMIKSSVKIWAHLRREYAAQTRLSAPIFLPPAKSISASILCAAQTAARFGLPPLLIFSEPQDLFGN
jgi:hypothetical protein